MDNRDFYRIFRRCHDGYIHMTTLPDKKTYRFSTDDADGMYDFAVTHGSECSVYVNCNPRRKDLKAYKRGQDDDVSELLCIVADCDVLGPAHTEKELPPTKESVISLLSEFEKEPTFLIDSGYGIYAYYVFEKPMALDSVDSKAKADGIIKGFGHKLTDLFQSNGWKLDNVFALSHMFRAPGSMNRKLDTAVECNVIYESGTFYSLEDFAEYYEAPTTTEQIPFDADERVVGSAERIMEKCEFLRKMLDDPDAVTEPEWKAQCSNVVLTPDGDEKFQDWSSHYSGYSYEETAYKIERAKEAKKPCTCKYISERLGFQCPEGGCGVKAPVVLALYTKQEQIENLLQKEKLTVDDVLDDYALCLAAYAKERFPALYSRLKIKVKETKISLRDYERAVRQCADMKAAPEFSVEPTDISLPGIDLYHAVEPYGYQISMEDGVSTIINENGVSIPVTLCHEPIVITKRLENIDRGQEKLELSFFHNDRWKNVVAPRSVILSRNSLVKLADSGLPISSENAEGVVRYLADYEAANKKSIPLIRSIDRIGWVGKEFFPCVTDGEIVYEAEDADGIVSAITECGDYDLWLKTASEQRQNTFSRVILAASFASPILELLQNRVILLHIWHFSRSGKTAALKFALSVWGDPLRLMSNFNSTAVGLERRAGIMRHLPLGLDELQVLNEKRLSPALIVYSLGNGYGKTRGAKVGGLQEVPTWRNCIISTGEQPLGSENAMDGVDSRVLELYGPPIPDAETGRYIHQISENNYGYAGVEFVKFLIEMGSEKIKHDFGILRQRILDDYEGDPGIHLDNVVALSLADCYSAVCLFGITEDEAMKDSATFGKAILNNAKSLEKEDMVERAWQFTQSWIATNKTRFESTISPCYGKIEAKRVYVIASVLRQALEENGYNYTKCIKGFKERSYIDSFANAEGKDNVQCQKKIQGINVRAVSVRLEVEVADDDFLADPPTSLSPTEYLATG